MRRMSATTPSPESRFAPFREKMLAAGLSQAALRAFEGSYAALEKGFTGMIHEGDIEPARDLPSTESLPKDFNPKLLEETVFIKLNGGLGTGMGLEKAKSLLKVRGDDSFLDLIARQILRLRAQTGGSAPRFMLMNSFSTSADTLELFTTRYPAAGAANEIELMQNRVPKVLADTLEPLSWPANPELEWCPPGHGDIYTCIADGGKLDWLLSQGIKYAFVSNADNLGATVEPSLLSWFAASGKPFVMEVTRRTAADRKGGHLAMRKSDRCLLLRESAQCLKEDEEAFQDIDRHRYFNTNNLWIRLDRLKETITANGGAIPLPVIVNKKTADPRDSKSPAVYQLETAMGAAIECFADAGAIEVPRTRFAPVKTTSDLLAVRSDCYQLTEDLRLELDPQRKGEPPHVMLDGIYKMVGDLEAAFPQGAPSLVECDHLSIKGPGRIICDSGVIFRKDCTLTNPSPDVPFHLKAGVYEGEIKPA
jgi:UDP-N-acetylglucosamine pyrophosphorylase